MKKPNIGGACSEMPERFAYSLRETALKTNVSLFLVRQAIKNGDLQVKRIGRRVIVPTSAIEAWLNRTR